MKYLLIILSIFLLASCSPTKRLAKIYKNNPGLMPTDSIDIRTEYKEKIVLRDTTVKIYLPGDTVWEEAEVKTPVLPNKQVKITPDTLKAESNYAISKTWISDNKLVTQLIDKELFLEVKLDSAIRESSYWKEKYTYERQVIAEKYTPKFWKITGWIGIITIIFLIVYLVLKISFKKKLFFK